MTGREKLLKKIKFYRYTVFLIYRFLYLPFYQQLKNPSAHKGNKVFHKNKHNNIE